MPPPPAGNRGRTVAARATCFRYYVTLRRRYPVCANYPTSPERSPPSQRLREPLTWVGTHVRFPSSWRCPCSPTRFAGNDTRPHPAPAAVPRRRAEATDSRPSPDDLDETIRDHQLHTGCPVRHLPDDVASSHPHLDHKRASPTCVSIIASRPFAESMIGTGNRRSVDRAPFGANPALVLGAIRPVHRGVGRRDRLRTLPSTVVSFPGIGHGTVASDRAD